MKKYLLSILPLIVLVFNGCISSKNPIPPKVERTIIDTYIGDKYKVGKIRTVYVGESLIDNSAILYNTVKITTTHINFQALYDLTTFGTSIKKGNLYYATNWTFGKNGRNYQLGDIIVDENGNDVKTSQKIFKPIINKSEEIKKEYFKEESFVQRLIYNGLENDNIIIKYQEFSDNMIRQSFSNTLKYNIKKNKIFRYKELRVKVIDVDNEILKFKVIEAPKNNGYL
ncbi:hypothetical protein [Arcobacter sp. YIC-310]|uniref:hypothetical protein n=1 Tax=Arcobacter sp. YIC-310 TaxID=3376632 RepID=UPI003C15F481